VTRKNLPRVHWEDEQLGLRLDIGVSFVDSEVIIDCESNLYATKGDLSEVYKRVFDTARAAVDCFSFLNGMGLSVILERVIPPNGIQHNILVTRPDLAKLSTAFNIEDFNAIYGISLSDPSILLAINDLIASIAMSHHAPINCGRVIETIREVMTPTGADREIGWQNMRENLKSTKSGQTRLTPFSWSHRVPDPCVFCRGGTPRIYQPEKPSEGGRTRLSL